MLNVTAHVRFQARVKRKRKEAADFLFALAGKGPWEINSCMDALMLIRVTRLETTTADVHSHGELKNGKYLEL